MKKLKCLLVVVSVVVASGCTTMADSIAAKGSGPYRVYEKPKPEVWEATVDAVNAVGLTLVTENESSNMILAQRGITMFSYGENVAIFVEPESEGQCRVEIISKKAMQTNIFAPDWSNSLFSYLDRRLKLK